MNQKHTHEKRYIEHDSWSWGMWLDGVIFHFNQSFMFLPIDVTDIPWFNHTLPIDFILLLKSRKLYPDTLAYHSSLTLSSLFLLIHLPSPPLGSSSALSSCDAFSDDSRQTWTTDLFFLWPSKVVRTLSDSPLNCIICICINFSNRCHLLVSGDNILSLHLTVPHSDLPWVLIDWQIFLSLSVSVSLFLPLFHCPSTPLKSGIRRNTLDLCSVLLLKLAAILRFWFLL